MTTTRENKCNTRSSAGAEANSRRRKVEHLLPPQTLSAIRADVALLDEITTHEVREIARRYRLAEDYEISNRRVGAFLRRLLQQPESRSSVRRSPRQPSEGAEDAGEASPNTAAYRRRQASVARILDGMFGQLASRSPELWGHHAYLMLMGIVYDRLATNEDELSTDELVTLAKVIADQRRIEVSSRKAAGAGTTGGEDASSTAGDSDEPLPPEFDRIVRRIYGANFHEPTKTVDPNA